jgi:hypothetical protein
LKALSDKLGAFTPLKELYDLKTADDGGKLRIIGYSRVGVNFKEWKCRVEQYSKLRKT